MTFPEKMERWMHINNLSQREVARRFQISQSFLSQILSGKRLAGPDMVNYINKITDGTILKSDIRPDKWA